MLCVEVRISIDSDGRQLMPYGACVLNAAYAVVSCIALRCPLQSLHVTLRLLLHVCCILLYVALKRAGIPEVRHASAPFLDTAYLALSKIINHAKIDHPDQQINKPSIPDQHPAKS